MSEQMQYARSEDLNRAEIQSEGAEFWEQGRVHLAPTFGQQIAELRMNPELRPDTIYADPAAVIQGKVAHPELSEGEAMLELDDFIGMLQHAQEDDAPTKEGLFPGVLDKGHEYAGSFREDFTFLGSKEYGQAVHGIAGAWLSYVQKSPDHVLNVYDHQRDGGEVKSYNKILADVLAVLAADPTQAAYLARIRTTVETWEDTPEAKLIVVDDYSATDATLEYLAREAARTLRDSRPDIAKSLTSKFEAHLLLALPSQKYVESDLDEDTIVGPIRSYFTAPSNRGAHDLNPSSMYSSMDYGFSEVITHQARNLRAAGYDIADPLLTHIDKPYARDVLTLDPVATPLLAELGYINFSAMPENRRQKHERVLEHRNSVAAIIAQRRLLYREDPAGYAQATKEDSDAYEVRENQNVAERRALEDREEELIALLKDRSKVLAQ